MRAFKLIVMALLLMNFISCSKEGPTGTASIQITKGFLVGNSSFDGGFFIHGLNLQTNTEFSFALDSGSQANIDIPYGQWYLRIVGWDDSSDTQPFLGNTLCGDIVFNFTNENRALSVGVTEAACRASVGNTFAGPLYVNAAQPNFRSLDIYTCGALWDSTFYNATTANYASHAYNTNVVIPAASFTPSFCQGNKYPNPFLKMAGSLKITFNNLLPGSRPFGGVSSECIIATAGVSSTGRNIPTKIPMSITLYEDSTCSENSILNSYYFNNGIEAVGAYDSILKVSGSIHQLALSSSPSQYGRTPFFTEIPYFQCNGEVPCLTISAPPLDYFLDRGNSQVIRIANQNCSGPFSSTSLVLEECRVQGNDAFLKIQVPIAASGSETFTFSGTTFTVTIQNYLNQMYSTLSKVIGYNIIPANRDALDSLGKDTNSGKDFKAESSPETHRYGLLTNVQNILSNWSGGGIFSDQPCTNPMTIPTTTRYLTIYTPEGSVLYEYILKPSPSLTVPKTMFDHDNTFPPSTLSSVYDARLIKRRFDATFGFRTEAIVDFECDNNITLATAPSRRGRSEELREIISGSAITTEQRLMYWNLEVDNLTLSGARFEVFEHTKEENTAQTPTLIKQTTSIYRANRIDSTDSMRVSALEFYSQLIAGGSTYEERLKRFEIDNSAGPTGNLTYKQISDITRSGVVLSGTIFNDSLYQEEKEKEFYDFRDAIQLGFQPALKTSTAISGAFVQAYPVATLPGTLKISSFNGTNAFSQDIVNTPNVQDVAVDITDDGTHMVVISKRGANLYMFVSTDSGATFTSTTALGISATLTDLKVGIIKPAGLPEILIAGIDSGFFKFSITKSNGTATPFPVIVTPAVFLATGARELSILKTNNSIFNLYLNHKDGSNNNTMSICYLNFAQSTCTGVNGTDFGNVLPILNSAGEFYSDMSVSLKVGVPVVTFFHNGPNVYKKATFLGTAVPYSLTTPTLTASQADHIPYTPSNIETYNAGSYAPTATTSMSVPYFPLSNGAKMNLMSLDPTTFINNFTNSTTFRILQN